MTRTRIWIMAAALFVVTVSVAGVTLAHTLSGDAEVRISARRLDDGRTEFALQQRADGEWGERILPRSRFFPASPRDDRWLNSSVLNIETEADPDADGASAAELAAAQAEAAEANEALADAQAELAAAQATLAELQAPIRRELGTMTFADGRIRTEVEQQAALRSTQTIQADGEYALSDIPLTLEIDCSDGYRTTTIKGIQFAPTESDRGPSQYSLSYQLSPAPSEGSATVRGDAWWGQEDWNAPGQHRTYPMWGRTALYLRLSRRTHWKWLSLVPTTKQLKRPSA